MIYERLCNLCSSNKTTPTALCVKISGNKGNLRTWKKGNIRSDYLKAIASEFNVSIDYLLCNTDDPSPISETKKSAAEKLGDAVIGALVKAGKIEADEPLTPELVDSVVRVVYTFASLET